MYAAFDGKDLIAFHEDEKVIELYCDIIEQYHGTVLTIAKIKKKKCKKIKEFNDLYLVRYGEIYIQQGYVDYMQFSCQQINEDHIQARDILMRIISTADLEKEEVKTLRKSVVILNDIINDEQYFIPDLPTLKRMKLDYDPYRYNYNIWK